MALRFTAAREQTAVGARQARRIAVISTPDRPVATALRTAANLALRSRSGIVMIVPCVVPYPAPLATPPVSIEWCAERFRALARQYPTDVEVRICLCREAAPAVLGELPPESLIVLAAGRLPWVGRNRALERKLRRAGHCVVYAAAD